MILVVFGILASAGIGGGVEHRWPVASARLSARAIQVLLYGLMPFVTFFSLARLDLGANGVGVGLLLGWAEILCVAAIAWTVSSRLLHLDRVVAGTVTVGCLLANTGYLGVPLNAALLGRDAIGPAIAWDVAISGPMLFTFGFGIAAACGTAAGDTARDRLKAFLTRNPPLLALVAGLLVPDALAPDVLVSVAHDAAIALLPLGFFVLGVHLRREQEDGTIRFLPPLTREVGLVLGLRLLAAPALFALFALSLPEVPDAYRLQAAMPCGINALIAAHTYGLDLRLAASAVGWSTAVGVAAAGLAGVVS
ncbi:MAG: transporter [Solirubrobacterales bacterium]|nr:transporter [Solirubrobacterales bacterium]